MLLLKTCWAWGDGRKSCKTIPLKYLIYKFILSFSIILRAHILNPGKGKFPMNASEGHRKQKVKMYLVSCHHLGPSKIIKMPACKMYLKWYKISKNCLNQETLKKKTGLLCYQQGQRRNFPTRMNQKEIYFLFLFFFF